MDADVRECLRVRNQADEGLMGDASKEVTIIRGCGGNAASLSTSLGEVRTPFVYVVDGDIVGNEAKITRFIARQRETDADIVVGTKKSPRLRNRLYFSFVRTFLGVNITDTQTGARLFRTEILRSALDRALSKTGAFDLELLTIAAGRGAKIAEVEIPEQLTKECGAKPSKKFVFATVKDTLAIFYRARILGYYAKCLVPRSLEKLPLVSIVIACPKRSWMLDECLNAIERQTYRNFEVIVLDDVKTGKVRPAEKRNLGIKEAKGEILAFIDDDAYPDAHWLEFAVKYFGEESIGAVGGPGVTPPGDDYLAKIGGRIYDNLLVTGNYRYRYRAGGVRRDCEDFPSCNLFVRKELLERIGGYRTDFWPGEDTLLCKDILDSWKRIIYDPWVIVYHHRRPLLMPHIRQLGRYGFHRGYFCKRYPSNSLRLSYFVPTLFVAYLLFVLPLTYFSYLAAIPFALYLLLVGLTTFAVNPFTWILTALGVFVSHITYGIQFMRGLLARKAPCEFIGTDHGSAHKKGIK